MSIPKCSQKYTRRFAALSLAALGFYAAAASAQSQSLCVPLDPSPSGRPFVVTHCTDGSLVGNGIGPSRPLPTPDPGPVGVGASLRSEVPAPVPRCVTTGQPVTAEVIRLGQLLVTVGLADVPHDELLELLLDLAARR